MRLKSVDANVRELKPGEHIAVVTSNELDAIEYRFAGLELRDTLLVLRPGPRVGFVFLFRKPLAESNTVQQMLATGTGAINIDATRFHRNGIGSGRWPANLVLIHGSDCKRDALTSVEGCSASCPAHWLDQASGFSESSDDPERFRGTVKFKNKHYVKEGDRAAATITNQQATAYGDKGGGTRYFPGFFSEEDFRTWLHALVMDGIPKGVV